MAQAACKEFAFPDTGEWFRPRAFTVKDLKRNLFHSQESVQEHGWGAVYLENHDQNRSANKFLPEADINYYSKTMLASLFLFLRGTPFIFQGQEIGMENIRMESLDEYNDIATHGQYERAIEAGFSPEEAFELVTKRSRDNSRTPMQWDAGKNAGFSDAETTWLKVNPNYKEINVEQQLKAEDSVFRFYQRLIGLRREGQYSHLIVHGTFQPYETEDEAVVAYRRNAGAESLLVLHNFQNQKSTVKIPEGYLEKVIGNYESEKLSNGEYRLRPYECTALYKIK